MRGRQAPCLAGSPAVLPVGCHHEGVLRGRPFLVRPAGSRYEAIRTHARVNLKAARTHPGLPLVFHPELSINVPKLDSCPNFHRKECGDLWLGRVSIRRMRSRLFGGSLKIAVAA